MTMEINSIIPIFDFVGALGFFVAFILGVQNYYRSDVDRIFWLAFSFTSGLGTIWLVLVGVEWLGFYSVILDIFSTSLQAVVIGLFAIGTTVTLVIVDDLKASLSELERQRDNARIARAQAERREETLQRTQYLLEEVEEIAAIGGWEYTHETEEFRLTDGMRDLLDLPQSSPISLASFCSLFPEGSESAIREAIETCHKTDGSFEFEVRLISKTGSELWIHLKGEPVADSNNPTCRGILQDISIQKEREQQLMVLTRILRHNLRNKLTVVRGYTEDIADQLSKVDPLHTKSAKTELSTAVEKLEQSTGGLTDEFTSVVSSIIDFPGCQVQQNIQYIKESCDELATISDKSIRFQQAVDPEQDFEPVALGPLLVDIRDELVEQYPNAEINIDAVDFTVSANPSAVRLAVTELLENAIIHTEKSNPHVIVSGDAFSSDQRYLHIQDNGPGIPKMEQEVVEQAKETPLSHGSGIGLWNVNWLMSRIRGGIEIAENSDGGSIVTLRFPVSQ